MSVAEEIQKLQELRQSGAIDDQEFAQAKARVLSGASAASSSGSSSAALSTPMDPATLESQTRQWATLLHISVLATYLAPVVGVALPILIWQWKKDELPEVDIHGKHAANWSISHLIYMIVTGMSIVTLIGIPFFLTVVVLGVVFPIMAAIKANNGEVWKYPLSITFFK